MKIVCRDCGCEKGVQNHSEWCSLEYARSLQAEAWEQGYYQGIHDEATAADMNYEMNGHARVNPYWTSDRMWTRNLGE